MKLPTETMLSDGQLDAIKELLEEQETDLQLMLASILDSAVMSNYKCEKLLTRRFKKLLHGRYDELRQVEDYKPCMLTTLTIAVETFAILSIVGVLLSIAWSVYSNVG
jgi:hypothetical protein